MFFARGDDVVYAGKRVYTGSREQVPVHRRGQAKRTNAGTGVFQKLAARLVQVIILLWSHRSAFHDRLVQVQQNVRHGEPLGQALGCVLREHHSPRLSNQRLGGFRALANSASRLARSDFKYPTSTGLASLDNATRNAKRIRCSSVAARFADDAIRKCQCHLNIGVVVQKCQRLERGVGAWTINHAGTTVRGVEIYKTRIRRTASHTTYTPRRKRFSFVAGTNLGALRPTWRQIPSGCGG